MSPILVRPVREQLEHDRVIRLLQQDLQKRKVEVGINPGAEQNASVGSGSRKEYPDAVVYALDKGKKVVAVVEVETGESVNHLEAMAQWAHLAKLRVPFHLYVPINSVDVARRLSHDYKIAVTEIWSYHQVGDQFKFTLIQPVGGRNRGPVQPPRTVSVASIRVALPLEPDLPQVDEVPAASASSPAPKGPPVRVVAAKASGTGAAPPAPRVVPVKAAAKTSLPTPAAVAKVAFVKPVVAKVAAAKPTAATPAPVKPVVKAVVAKSPGPVREPVKPAVKPAAKAAPKAAPKPPAKPAVKAPARAVPKARPVAKPVAKPVARRATAQSPKASARPVAKAPARPASRAVSKPVAKRK